MEKNDIPENYEKEQSVDLLVPLIILTFTKYVLGWFMFT